MRFLHIFLLMIFSQLIIFAQSAKILQTETYTAKIIEFSSCTEQPKTNSAWLEYSYSNGTVFFNHVNAYFNCATYAVDILVTVKGNKIQILEKAKRSALAGCGCFFNIQFQVSGIKPGLYGIELISDDQELYPNLVRAIFDLKNMASGAVRVDNLPGVVFVRPTGAPFFLIK